MEEGGEKQSRVVGGVFGKQSYVTHNNEES